ncbi:hypothetical protein Q0590_31335 [Rhodocytophaga aerolata]|uniref:HEAT repeat domain-containing protein n=1 Tax=Rhodocytophaga aerolata TaxID=455078 RepID=A0ABT8RFC8_9BACT|nr:hypothetical protein [Rhodocytophaga aerolata]MDO1450809.1 hypothetical protein [Rhodocytophaga aerolata]
MYIEKIEQLYIDKLSYDHHNEFEKIYNEDKASFSKYLVSDLKESIDEKDYDKICFWMIVITMLNPLENKIEDLIINELFCDLLDRMLEGMEQVDKEEAYKRSWIIYKIQDILFNHPEIAEVNKETMIQLLASVCRFDYRKEQWANTSYNKKYGDFTDMVEKTLTNLRWLAKDNQTAWEIIKECLRHFDADIKLVAQEYLDDLNERNKDVC